jgi:DNA replication protein DnaC
MGNLIKILKEANPKREAFLNKVSLLIIDEVGYFPIERYESYLFFQLISNKYEKSSIIITSNKSFIEWGDIFSDQALVGVILNRWVKIKLQKMGQFPLAIHSVMGIPKISNFHNSFIFQRVVYL